MRPASRLLGASLLLAAAAASPDAHAITSPFTWKGYTWNATSGGMAGVCTGDPTNVSIDASGYLHLRIVKNGAAWSASEVFTTTKLGFGTYQWQIAGPLDRMDHTVVLGLFPYGPQAGIGADGTNEIDTEFSFWNDELTNVNADWGVYPPDAAATHWEDDFLFSLDGGSAATTRLTWSAAGITGTLMSGFQSVGATASVLATTVYMPDAGVSAEIPQQALPLGMNLWCYKAPPSSGQNVELVIQDFQFIPEGQPIPDGGAGEGGAGNDGGTGTSDSGAGDAGVGPNPSDAAVPVGDAASGGGVDATVGDAGTGGAVASAGTGCGCVVGRERETRSGMMLAVAALGLVAARRRRRR